MPPLGRSDHRGVGTGVDAAELLPVLATLLEAGLPLSRALHDLARTTSGRQASAVSDVLSAIRDGGTFHAALASRGVPVDAVSMIETGERAGRLAAGVRAAAEWLETSRRHRQQVLAALTYPAMLLLATVGVAVLFAFWLAPRFASTLEDMQVAVPPSLDFVLGVASAVRLMTPVLVALAALTAGALVASPAIRERVSIGAMSLAGRLPIIGRLRALWASAQVAASLAALVRSGVPLARAVGIVAATSGRADVRARLERVRRHLRNGAAPSVAMRLEGALSARAQRLLMAGDLSGQVGLMLDKAAELDHWEWQQQLGRAVRLVEPALLLGIGGMVGLLAAVLLQTMYSVRPT
jgi:general secretion pathway protein F